MRHFVIAVIFATTAAAEEISIGNETLQRTLTLRDGTWMTSKITNVTSGVSLEMLSDEFSVLLMNDQVLLAKDYTCVGKPIKKQDQLGQTLLVSYEYSSDKTLPEGAPKKVDVEYKAMSKELCLRKRVVFTFPSGKEPAVDRLEVERYSVKQDASRGGRGEPVWIDGGWFCGLEYPAGHSRHTDGNTPLADSHHFEKVGNHSVILLDGKDIDGAPRKGLVRLFHFPSPVQSADGVSTIVSKSAVIGGGNPDINSETAFRSYLQTVMKADRSFTHYNNWFDRGGKSLKGDNFVTILQSFQQAMKPYGVKIDAMVPDNGWQNNSSVWEPSTGHFPNGFADLKLLSEKLRKEGSSLGLWLSLDGTQSNIDWGISQGYTKAKANKYFSQYFAHYSMSNPTYKAKIVSQLKLLAGEGGISYFKHDFNHLCDMGEGNGHFPTDRHGHEANVDAMIEMVMATREANPQIYQNLTNWMWYSPWWLMYGDAIWMLAGDDGANGNWPELSVRNTATTDRDAYLWRMWGEPSDRPLIPISRIMTHGIILNSNRQLEGPKDGVAEWADHVMMYYGRGVQMKEWYITPAVASADHWRALGSIHRWSELHFDELKNTYYVGSRPDEGHVYGYIGWCKDRAVFVTRNPDAAEQTVNIPFTSDYGCEAKSGSPFQLRVVYPYHEILPLTAKAGGSVAVKVPGYATLAFEISAGASAKTTLPSLTATRKSGEKKSSTNSVSTTFSVPVTSKGRTELIVIGYPKLPQVLLNGSLATPMVTNHSSINNFAGYARDGMISKSARDWQIASYSLEVAKEKDCHVELVSSEGKAITAEAWVLTEHSAVDDVFDEAKVPWAIAAGLRRQTEKVITETTISAPMPEVRELTTAEWAGIKSASVVVELFGVNPADTGEKAIFINGQKIATLPTCGDAWMEVSVPVAKEFFAQLKNNNSLEIRRATNVDKFKFRNPRLIVTLSDGKKVMSRHAAAVQTSDRDWAHFEGDAFPEPLHSSRIALDMKP
jgi:hypothetical protein